MIDEDVRSQGSEAGEVPDTRPLDKRKGREKIRKFKMNMMGGTGKALDESY